MNVEQEIYRIIDHFLTEATNQDGAHRSVERLNQDRHLAVRELLELIDRIVESLHNKPSDN